MHNLQILLMLFDLSTCKQLQQNGKSKHMHSVPQSGLLMIKGSETLEKVWRRAVVLFWEILTSHCPHPYWRNKFNELINQLYVTWNAFPSNLEHLVVCHFTYVNYPYGGPLQAACKWVNVLKYTQGRSKTWDWGCHSVFEGDQFKPTEGF